MRRRRERKRLAWRHDGGVSRRTSHDSLLSSPLTLVFLCSLVAGPWRPCPRKTRDAHMRVRRIDWLGAACRRERFCRIRKERLANKSTMSAEEGPKRG